MHRPRVVSDRAGGIARQGRNVPEAGFAGQIAGVGAGRADRPAEIIFLGATEQDGLESIGDQVPGQGRVPAAQYARQD